MFRKVSAVPLSLAILIASGAAANAQNFLQNAAQNESSQIQQEYNSGQINGAQAGRLQQRDAQIQSQEQNYMNNHGGQLSQREEHKIGSELQNLNNHAQGDAFRDSRGFNGSNGFNPMNFMHSGMNNSNGFSANNWQNGGGHHHHHSQMGFPGQGFTGQNANGQGFAGFPGRPMMPQGFNGQVPANAGFGNAMQNPYLQGNPTGQYPPGNPGFSQNPNWR